MLNVKKIIHIEHLGFSIEYLALLGSTVNLRPIP
jgi:hypothetical protein